MSIKNKIMNAMTVHPKLVTFTVGLGITMAIGTAIGMLDHSQMAFAVANSGSGGSGCCLAMSILISLLICLR